MAEQKALFLDKKQGSFVLGTREIENPQPGELLVKIKAVALNPVEWKVQTYGMLVENYPAILGTDIAGEVEAVGEGVEGFAKGDRVCFQGFRDPAHAGYQQYTRVPAEMVSKIPSKYTYSQAASVPACFATAAIGLFSAQGIGLNPVFESHVQYKGQAAVVIGGSSSVGQYAIQVLRFAGFSTIITYASGHHTEFLKSLGATHVIDRKQVTLTDLTAAVKKITNGLVPIAYDAISDSDTQTAAYDLLTDDGKMVVTLPSVLKEDAGSKKVVGFIRASVYLDPNRAFGRTIHRSLTTWLEDGVFVPNRVEELPNGLASIVGGLERLKNNQVSGVKLVVNPQETP